MKKILIGPLLLGIALLQGGSGIAAEHKTEGEGGKVCAMDKAWAEMAALSDLTEITLSKAAEKRGTSEQVRQLAARMIQDHTKTTDELKEWAKANGVELKSHLPPEKEAVVEEITSKSGAEFDKAYIDHNVALHRMAVAHFKNGAEFDKDPQLKSFAEQNLPTIEEHLTMVQRMAPSSQTTAGAAENGASRNAAPQPATRTQSGQATEGQVHAQ